VGCIHTVAYSKWRVPMTVVGLAEQSQVFQIGATPQRIRQDVVYLYQMS